MTTTENRGCAPRAAGAPPRRIGAVESARLSLEVARDTWLRRRPFLLYLMPTLRCDCRCAICDRWQRQSRGGDELSLEEIKGIIGKFRRAGAVVFTLWGGEPFLRKDLPDMLEAAKARGLRTALCTNGNLLPRRCGEVVPLLDVMLCSLDGYGRVHDELRGVKGLFDRVVRGIEEARRFRGCEVKIWAVVHGRNGGEVEKLARLAKDLGVGIEFFPVSPIAGYNEGIVLTPGQREEAFRLVQELKRSGFPVRNPDHVLEIMRRSRPFHCNYPAIAIHIDHRGTVYSCEFPQSNPLHSWGPHGAFDPEKVYPSREFREVSSRLAACNRCRFPCVIELSGSLPRALAGMFLSRVV